MHLPQSTISIGDSTSFKKNQLIRQDSAEKMNYFPLIPKDILVSLFDSLPLFSCLQLSQTNHFMRVMFIGAALKPNVPKLIKEYLANLSVLALVSQKVTGWFSGQVDKPVMSPEAQFQNLDLKSKYLVCTKKGLARLKNQGMDGILIKSKLANGDFTEEAFLARRASVLKEIEAELQGPLDDNEKHNLESESVQELLFLGFLSMGEAKSLPFNAESCLQFDEIKKGLATNQISKQDVLNFKTDLFHAILLWKDHEVIHVNFTMVDVLKYPFRIIKLACCCGNLGVIFDRAEKMGTQESLKEEFLKLEDRKIDLLYLNSVQLALDNGHLTVSEMNLLSEAEIKDKATRICCEQEQEKCMIQ